MASVTTKLFAPLNHFSTPYRYGRPASAIVKSIENAKEAYTHTHRHVQDKKCEANKINRGIVSKLEEKRNKTNISTSCTDTHINFEYFIR